MALSLSLSLSRSSRIYLNFERTNERKSTGVARSSIRSRILFLLYTHHPPRYRTSIRIRFALTRISAIYIPPIRLPGVSFFFFLLFLSSFSSLFNLLVNPCHVKIPNFYFYLFIFFFFFFPRAYTGWAKSIQKCLVLNNTCCGNVT